MSLRMNRHLLQLSMTFLLSSSAVAAAYAASPAAGINESEINLLEQRFFSHAYAHDPVEKRLERLECLVFGSTREGSNTERLSRLTKIVAARSQQPLNQEKVQAPLADSRSASKAPETSRQYPVLNTLEWKALKRTFPAESLDQRLDRLESRMFGQPAQTMAYADRVERLKKTLGIGLENPGAGNITDRGPMPKARPRSDSDGLEGGMVMPMESYLSPGMNMEMDPFGGTTFGGAFKPFQQLMQSMDRQMSEMRRLGPGVWVQDPVTQEYVEQNSGRRVSPNGSNMPPASKPESKPKSQPFASPLLNREIQNREIPGYADPNSI